jgi:hypothetical protein
MKTVVTWWFALLAAFVLAGCATGPHSLWATRAQGQATSLTKTNHPPYCGKVFLTECSIPESQPAERIAKVDATTVTDEPTETVLKLLADAAREAGADGVIELKVWRQGAGFSWKAPQASGIAVIADTNCFQGLNGYWR